MSIRNGLFFSESVSESRPDKLADHVPDAVLDELLMLEPASRAACESLLAEQYVIVAGEYETRSLEAFRPIRVPKACFSAHVGTKGAP